MPPGCDHAVHVLLTHQNRERHFIVEFDAEGDALRIKERKARLSPCVGVHDASWWVASSHALGTKNTLPKRAIAAARAKMAAEEHSFNAAP